MTMKFLVLDVLLAGAYAAASRNQVTPVQKVIQLLEGMRQKGVDEKKAEELQYTNYQTFCNDNQQDKTQRIKGHNQKIMSLEADIATQKAKVKKMEDEITGHNGEVSTWQGDEKAATAVRQMDRNDYEAMHQDYSESVDAIERAIVVLQKRDVKQDQAALLQVSVLSSMTMIPAEAKQTVTNFVQASQDFLDRSNPEAHGYEFQSKGVITMLQELHDKFIDERTALEKKEMKSKQAFDMLMQMLADQIAQGKEDITTKTESKADALNAKASAEGDHVDTSKLLAADESYLSDLTATCKQKAADFQTRQALRSEEIAAIDKAIEIISSNAVSGHATKHLPTLLQGAVLAQLRRSNLASKSQTAAAKFLSQRASKLGSRTLTNLALLASEDPFLKVKDMISDLIIRLQQEATEEAKHKGWCDGELADNEHNRKTTQENIDKTTSTHDQAAADKAKLGEEIADLSASIAKLETATADATRIRNEEHEKNEVTVKEAGEAQSAVAEALTVLKEFYAKAAESTAFVQRQQPEAPEIFDEAYTGMQSENGGVIGMLEVIQADFARLAAETKSEEAKAQNEYDTFMTDSKVDKAKMSTTQKNKIANQQDRELTVSKSVTELADLEREMKAVKAYHEELQPACVDADVSYEDRVARREEEIESLQEALKILTSEAP